VSDVVVVGEADRARVLLDPTRQAILAMLETPASAASLAPALDVPRQRLNYHLHELERAGFVLVDRERQRGSVSERTYRRAGDTFAISVDALGPVGSRPSATLDRFSSGYQIAVASQAVADLAALRAGAAAAGKSLPTLTLEADIRFRTPAVRAAFAQELGEAIAALVRTYHDARAEGGRTYRLYIGAYPKPKSRSGGSAGPRGRARTRRHR
jgi:DNA-binding transcriptional ArsR family regulator